MTVNFGGLMMWEALGNENGTTERVLEGATNFAFWSICLETIED